MDGQDDLRYLPMIIELGNREKSLQVLCEEYGFHYRTALEYVREHYPQYVNRMSNTARKNIGRGVAKYIDIMDDVVRLYETCTATSIAKQLGVDVHTVLKSLDAAGIKDRGRWKRVAALEGRMGLYKDVELTDLQACFRDWCDTEFVRYEEMYEVPHPENDKLIPYRYDFLLVDISSVVFLYNNEYRRDRKAGARRKAAEMGYRVFEFSRSEVIETRGKCFDVLLRLFG